MRYLVLIAILASTFTVISCKKKKNEEKPVVFGCMNPNSINYSETATQDNGSCQFAERYLPLKVGNTWTLKDTISLPIPGFPIDVPVNAILLAEKDTQMDGKTYTIIQQQITLENLPIPGGGLSLNRYGYRTDRTGKVYRRVPGDSQEYLYLDYPLAIGKTWEDLSSDPNTYTTTANSLVSVPAISAPVGAWEITSLFQGQAIQTYFSNSHGIVRLKLGIDVMGFPLEIDAFLTEYQLQ